MRDKGRPLPPRDTDVLADTLKSLQDLIQEVGAPAVSAPAPAAPTAAEPRPAPAAAVAPAPEPARDARADRHAPVEFERATDASPPVVTYAEDSPIEWYDHPTGPSHDAPVESARDLGWDDIPMLGDVVRIPGASRPRADAATALPAVVDRILDRLDDELRSTTGLALDVGTRADLRASILSALQRWAAAPGTHRARMSSALSGQDDENPL